MAKKYIKFLCVKLILLAFLCVGFFYVLPEKTFALEVTYPTINNQALTSQTTLPDYVKYLFNLGMFVGFLSVFISLVVAGVMYFLSPVKADLIGEAKERISGAISGLLILALTYLIVVTINPQLSFLNLDKLPDIPTITPTQTKTPGVYFYKKTGCSDDTVTANTASVTDLGTAKNMINSIGLVQDDKFKTYYIPILYSTINFQGSCAYINPNQKCISTPPLPPDKSGVSSISIYPYDFSPNGDGVYFYRESYFDDNGGVYLVKNADIAKNGIYVEDLSKLSFVNDDGKCNVPDKDKDCIKYNTDGTCNQKICPTLAGGNISSIKISGNYIVILVYFAPKDDENGPWTACQEFPTPDDANKSGPQQIKWENIRNSGGVLPNFVIIIPVQSL